MHNFDFSWHLDEEHKLNLTSKRLMKKRGWGWWMSCQAMAGKAEQLEQDIILENSKYL
jgi:hypothetical protein